MTERIGEKGSCKCAVKRCKAMKYPLFIRSIGAKVMMMMMTPRKNGWAGGEQGQSGPISWA